MEASHLGVAAAARSTVQDDHRLAVGVAALLVIQGMASIDRQHAVVEAVDFGIKHVHEPTRLISRPQCTNATQVTCVTLAADTRLPHEAASPSLRTRTVRASWKVGVVTYW